MSNLIFPAEQTRTVEGVGTAGTPYTSEAGVTATIYNDAAGTNLASIAAYPSGSAIVSAQLTLDGYGRLPFFYGPDTTTTVLYVKVGTGPVTPIMARCLGTDDPNVKLLHTGVVSGSSATSSLALAATPGATLPARGATFADLARPRYYWRVYRVNPTNTATGEYATITAAITQARTDIATAHGTNTGDNCPVHRCLITIAAGTYAESINSSVSAVSCPQFVDLVGETGNRDDVIISYTSSGTGAPTMNAPGNCYIAHLTLALHGSATATGVHALNGGTRSDPFTFIAENCKFTSDNTATNGPNPVNVLCSPDATYLFIGSHFQADCTPPNAMYQAFQGGTSSSAPTPARPGQIVFIDCTASAPNNDGTLVSVVNFADNGSQQADVQAWLGGSITKGLAAATIDNNNQTTRKTGQFVIDPAIANVNTPNQAGQLVRTAAFVPPMVRNGMNDPTRDYYLPSAVTKPKVLRVSTPDVTTSTLTANRLYYLPLDLTQQVDPAAILATCTAGAAGKFWVGLYKDDLTGKPGSHLNRQNTSGQAIVTGLNTLGTFVTAHRPIFPGYGQVWLAICDDTGTATILCSQYLASQRTIYYQDLTPGFANLPTGSATPVALAAGTNVPVVSLSVQ